jgi:Xaa-Pro aminopeptidase
VIQQLLRGKRIKKVRVPESFPFGLARDLRKLRVKLTIRKEPFFPERATKTAEEIKRISGALMMAEVGLAEGLQTLKRAKVGRHRRLLLHHNVPLTAEKLRAIINTAVLQAGGLACHTIVSGGRQSCDPHEEGHGPLRAHEPIILDVFPRSQKTGYYGDITRTIVRGRASEAVRRLYATVAQAQALGFAQLSAQVAARDVHQRVQDFFESQGYKTGRGQGRMRGFFHGTGHGLGLELHEAPYLGATSADVLKPGHVVTVEPGLYYPELGGGVRLEDVAVVTRNGARNLTRFEKTLEI